MSEVENLRKSLDLRKYEWQWKSSAWPAIGGSLQERHEHPAGDAEEGEHEPQVELEQEGQQQGERLHHARTQRQELVSVRGRACAVKCPSRQDALSPANSLSEKHF